MVSTDVKMVIKDGKLVTVMESDSAIDFLKKINEQSDISDSNFRSAVSEVLGMVNIETKTKTEPVEEEDGFCGPDPRGKDVEDSEPRKSSTPKKAAH
jgi:hypothetical protein